LLNKLYGLLFVLVRLGDAVVYEIVKQNALYKLCDTCCWKFETLFFCQGWECS